MPRVSRSADGTAAGVDVGRGTAQPNAQATDTEATNMKACSVLTSNKSSVIGDGVLVTQCFVDGVAVVLNTVLAEPTPPGRVNEVVSLAASSGFCAALAGKIADENRALGW